MVWLELTKAQRGEQGLGHTTFSQCIKRLMAKDKVRRCQIAKNRFYQAIFGPGNSLGTGNDENDDLIVSVPDKAAEALAVLLNKRSPA
jgi:hypothetical protein